MTLHVGLATTLPPAPTGPAEFVAGVLPELARAARITCFVDDPGLVEPALRHRFDIRALDERGDPDVDIVVYHIANNLAQLASHQADVSIAADTAAYSAVACPLASGERTMDVLYVILPPRLGSVEWMAQPRAESQRVAANPPWTTPIGL